MQSTLPSPADYQAFIAAHPQLNLQYPATAEERARLAPAVIAWKRQQGEQRGPDAGDIAAAGLGLAGLGAGGYALWRLFGGDPAGPVASAATAAPLPPRQVPADAAMGATEATARENWRGQEGRRADAPPRPVTGAPLMAIDAKGSDLQRGLMGSYDVKKDRNLFGNEVIAALIEAKEFDKAEAILRQTLNDRPMELQKALHGLGVLAGEKSEVQKVFRGEVGRLGEGKEARYVIREVDENGEYTGRLVDANKEFSNTTIQVESPVKNGDNRVVRWERHFFSNGSGGQGGRKWMSLRPDYVAREGQARSTDDTVDTRLIEGVGRYKAGTNMNKALGDATIAVNPFGEPGGTDEVKATSATDPARQGELMLTLNSSRGREFSPGTGDTRVFTRTIPDGDPDPATGRQRLITVPLEVRTVADLPDEARQNILMRTPQGLVPVESLPPETPLPNGTELVQRHHEDRARFLISADENGNGNQLRELYRLGLSNRAMPLRFQYADETQAPFHDYSARPVQYPVLEPSRMLQSVEPAIGSQALAKMREGQWIDVDRIPRPNLTPDEAKTLRGRSKQEIDAFLNTKHDELRKAAAESNDIRLKSAVKIARAGMLAARAANPKFSLNSPRNQFSVTQAALENLGVPLTQLNTAVTRLAGQLEQGAEFDTQPLPWSLNDKGAYQRTIGQAPLASERSGFYSLDPEKGVTAPLITLDSKPKFKINRAFVAGDDIEPGMHSEGGSKRALGVARVVAALLQKDGGMTEKNAKQVSDLLWRSGVPVAELKQTMANVNASLAHALEQRNITPAERRSGLKREYAIGGRSATDIWLAANNEALGRGAQARGGHTAFDVAVSWLGYGQDLGDEARMADGEWKNLWMEQVTSALAEAPQLKESAARAALKTGLKPDIKAVASTYARMIPGLVQVHSGELAGLPLATQYGMVGEALTRAIEDYPAAMKWAATHHDAGVRELAARAVEEGRAGHFEFEQFARQYVGNAVSAMSIAEKTDGSNPAPLQIGEEAGAALLAEARSRAEPIEATVNRVIAGANGQFGALMALRGLTKDPVGTSKLPGKMGVEPHTSGAALANAFMAAPEDAVAGTAIGRLRFGDGNELGFDRPSVAPFAFTAAGAGSEVAGGGGSARYPMRLVFSSKASENRAFNEGSMFQGQAEGFQRPVRSATIEPLQADLTAVSGSDTPRQDALNVALERFGAYRGQGQDLESYVTPGLDADGNPVRGTSESRTTLPPSTKAVQERIGELKKRLGRAPAGSREQQQIQKAIQRQERIASYLERRPVSTQLRMAQLNTDVNRAMGQPTDATGGLVIDLDPRSGVPRAQKGLKYTGGDLSLEAMQERAGDSVEYSGAMVGTDRLSEMQREGRIANVEPEALEFAGAAEDDIAGFGQRIEELRSAVIAKRQELNVFEQVAADQATPGAERAVAKKRHELKKQENLLAQIDQVLAMRRQHYGALPGTSEVNDTSVVGRKSLAEALPPDLEKGSMVMLRESFMEDDPGNPGSQRIIPGQEEMVYQLFDNPAANWFGTREVAVMLPTEYERVKANTQNWLAQANQNWRYKQQRDARPAQAGQRRMAGELSQRWLERNANRPAEDWQAAQREAPQVTPEPPTATVPSIQIPRRTGGSATMAVSDAELKLQHKAAWAVRRAVDREDGLRGRNTAGAYQEPGQGLLDALRRQLPARQQEAGERRARADLLLGRNPQPEAAPEASPVAEAPVARRPVNIDEEIRRQTAIRQYGGRLNTAPIASAPRTVRRSS